jgi:CRISPR/Cas system CMR-associated protein Cmr5 small subunit
MPVRRIDQGMAVAAANALPQQVTGDLRTRYRQLRVLLHSAGLAASYAFIASKAGDPDAPGLPGAYGKVTYALKKQLVDLRLLTGQADDLGTPEVMRQLGGMDPVTYARASAEAAALVSWLSRLASAVAAENGLPGEDDGAP